MVATRFSTTTKGDFYFILLHLTQMEVDWLPWFTFFSVFTDYFVHGFRMTATLHCGAPPVMSSNGGDVQQRWRHGLQWPVGGMVLCFPISIVGNETPLHSRDDIAIFWPPS